MMRIAALTLALLSAAAAWVLVAFAEFDVLVASGTIALLAGLWVLGQPLPKRTRLAAAAFALTALPATAGLRIMEIAGHARPFSVYVDLRQKDLFDLTLPAASAGDTVWTKFDSDTPRVIVGLGDRTLMWRGMYVSLAELDDELRYRAEPVIVRVDKDALVGHVGWLLAVIRDHGRTEVSVVASRYADFYSDAEAEALGAERGAEYWPEVVLTLPLAAEEGGVRVRLVGTDVRERELPDHSRDSGRLVRVPAAVRYDLDGRATSDLRELSRWMRDKPPRWIEVDPAVPFKYLIAVQNQLKKAGLPCAALVLPDPPPKEIRDSRVLPYPVPR